MHKIVTFAYGLFLAGLGFVASVRHERALNRSLALGDEDDQGECVPANVPDGRIPHGKDRPYNHPLHGTSSTGPIKPLPPVFPGEEQLRAPKHPRA